MRRVRIGWALAACLLVSVACDQKKPAKKKGAEQAPIVQKYLPQPRTKRTTPEQYAPTRRVHKTPAALGVYAALREKDPHEWLGHQYMDGVQLRFQQFQQGPDAHKFALQLFDANASDGLSQLEEMLEKSPQPVAVIGHVSDKEAIAALKTYQSAKVLMLPVAAGSTELLANAGGQAYRITYADDYYARSIVALIKKKGWRRIVILSGPEPHAKYVAETAAEFALQSELEVLENQQATELEHADTLAKEMVVLKADVVLCVARNPLQALRLVRAFKEAGNKAPLVVSDGGAGQDFLAQMRSPSSPLFIATGFDPNSPRGQEFSKSFAAQYKRTPDLWAALAYDLAGLFIDGLNPREVIVTTFEQHLRDLTADEPFPGVTGEVYFDRSGQAVARPVHLLRWQGERFEKSGASMTAAERLVLFGAEPAPDKTGDGPKPTDDTPKPKPGGIHWYDSIADAMDAADESGKPILVDFYSITCVPCVRMEKTTWHAKNFAEAAKDWILLRVNLDKTPILSKIYKTPDLPVFGYWTSDGAEATRTGGYKSADEIVAEMKTMRGKVETLAKRIQVRRMRIEDPDDPGPQRDLAKYLKQHSAFVKAADAYENAQAAYFANENIQRGCLIYLDIIWCRSRANDLAGGRRACEEWFTKYPKSKNVGYAYWMAGTFSSRLGQKDKAKGYWKSLVAKFPADNLYVKRAKLALAR